MDSLVLADNTILGKKVIAMRPFGRGETIIEFTGPRVHPKDIPSLRTPADDRFLQVGLDEYLGESGKFDDFFNHFCRPNAGLVENSHRYFLTAIRKIKPGEQITWDYSTCMDEDDWKWIVSVAKEFVAGGSGISLFCLWSCTTNTCGWV